MACALLPGAPAGAAEPAATGRLHSPHSPQQNLIIENNAITLAEFWQAYTSRETEPRRRAELFLLGVLDSTEGSQWCDYRRVKTIAIDELLFSRLKKRQPEQSSERAARVIVDVLRQAFPCRSPKHG